MENILKQQVLEIREVIFTIDENVSHMRSDLEICLPELKNVLNGLRLVHWSDIKQFASKLGAGHPLVSLWEQRAEILEEAATRHYNS